MFVLNYDGTKAIPIRRMDEIFVNFEHDVIVFAGEDTYKLAENDTEEEGKKVLEQLVLAINVTTLPSGAGIPAELAEELFGPCQCAECKAKRDGDEGDDVVDWVADLLGEDNDDD